MNIDETNIKTTGVQMKHYDGAQGSRAQQESNLIAKEASCVQCCGYVPTDQLSQREWDAMEQQDKRGRIYDDRGYYSYQKDDVYDGEQRSGRE